MHLALADILPTSLEELTILGTDEDVDEFDDMLKLRLQWLGEDIAAMCQSVAFSKLRRIGLECKKPGEVLMQLPPTPGWSIETAVDAIALKKDV